MISIHLDYRNLQFIIYQNDKPVENPLPVEVQRVLIEKIALDVRTDLERLLVINLDYEGPKNLRKFVLHEI